MSFQTESLSTTTPHKSQSDTGWPKWKKIWRHCCKSVSLQRRILVSLYHKQWELLEFGALSLLHMVWRLVVDAVVKCVKKSRSQSPSVTSESFQNWSRLGKSCCVPPAWGVKKKDLYCAIYDATTSAAANTLHNPKSFGASADEERCDRDHSNHSNRMDSFSFVVKSASAKTLTVFAGFVFECISLNCQFWLFSCPPPRPPQVWLFWQIWLFHPFPDQKKKPTRKTSQPVDIKISTSRTPAPLSNTFPTLVKKPHARMLLGNSRAPTWLSVWQIHLIAGRPLPSDAVFGRARRQSCSHNG